MTRWAPGKKSAALFEAASAMIPGGVNSPVRAFRSVGLQPFFVERAKGPFVYDVDGNEYIDFVGSWGPLITGHAQPDIIAALIGAAHKGTSFGASHAGEAELASLIQRRMPGVEMVRLVSSGTEAAMSAVRLARGFTGRHRIIKFAGCYHGHADAFLIDAGSGVATLGVPGSPGVPPGSARDTLSAIYNDLDSVDALLCANKGEVAAVIVEPVAGNIGCVPPLPAFLPGLRRLCDAHGALLIFDEVITGFRVARGGAAERYRVTPDLTVLGKILGGGMPLGAFGGRRDIMACIAPSGPVYQAGTLSGNPVAVACGIAALSLLGDATVYDQLEATGAAMEAILRDSAAAAGATIAVNRVASMMSFFFQEGPVRNYADVQRSDSVRFNRLFAALLTRGVSIAPSAFEAMFVSTAHDDAVLERAATAFKKAFCEVEEG